MKYYKNTLCLAPFVEHVKKHIPYDRIQGIKTFRVPLGKIARTNGLCTRSANGTFVISLNLWRPNDKFTKHYPIEMYSVLETLAHELAHARHWGDDHGHKHFRCYLLLLGKFAKLAKELGLENFETPIQVI